MSRVAGLVGDCTRIIYLVLRLHVYPNKEYLDFFFSFPRPSSFSRSASSPTRVTASSNNPPPGRGNAASPVIRDVRQIDALSDRDAQTEKSSLETH